MSQYRLTLKAQADLEEIFIYVAADGGEAMADRVVAELIAAFERLAALPGLGRTRSDVTDPRFRFWKANRFLIAYYPDTDPLEIIRLVGGRRDLRTAFGGSHPDR